MLSVKIFLLLLFCKIVQGHLLPQDKCRNNDQISVLVKNLVVEMNSKDSTTRDVVILKFPVNEQSNIRLDDMAQSILEALPKENIVTSPKLNEVTRNKRTRKSSMIIIVSDSSNGQYTVDKFTQAEKSQYWNNLANFIFISAHTEKTALVQIASFLMTLKCYNAIIIGQGSESFQIFSFNPFVMGVNRFYELKANMTHVMMFPDKQRNMNRYPYNVLFYNDYPRIYAIRNMITGPDVNFLTVIAKHQNSGLRFKQIPFGPDLFIKHVYSMSFDLSPNTGVHIVSNNSGTIKQVDTYETDGFCAMLPIPERISFFDYFLKPFDRWVWLLSALATTVFAVIWRLLNRNFSIITYILHFFGENLTFPQRRLIEKILLLLKYFLVFIITLGYESFIVSYMANSRQGQRLKTVNELIDSNLTLMVDPVFASKFSSSELYTKLTPRIDGKVDFLSDLRFKELSEAKIGLVLTCSTVETFYKATEDFIQGDKTAIDFYYKLPEKLQTFYLRFLTGPFSPFTDRLQEYSLRIFEGGLRQLWNSLVATEEMKAIREREAIASGDYLMKLADIAGAFYLLGIGLALAALTLVLEVIWGYGHEIFWFLP